MKKRSNSELAGIFYEIADILELKKVRWKPQAYRIAAQTIESLRQDVYDIYKKEGIEGLDKLPGIGSGISKKIVQYIKTGKVQELEKLKKRVPAGLYQMMNIPGIGAKKASVFYHKLGIKSIKQLKEAARKGKIRKLPSFKEKSEKNIIEGIKLMKGKKARIPLKQAEKIAGKIISEIRKLKQVKKIEAAGSLRRKKPSVGDFDLVILTSKPKEVADKFVKMSFVKKVLGKGKEKASIISKQGIQVDIRLFDKNSYGAGLLYFTGDKSHNIWLRNKAIKRGWKLSEYGLFDKKTGRKIAGKTESEIYKKLGVKMVRAEMRVGETE